MALFYKVNCYMQAGSVLTPHSHFVVASSDDEAIAAVMADVQASGAECFYPQLIPMQTDVIVGS
jgi:hypothetical protein